MKSKRLLRPSSISLLFCVLLLSACAANFESPPLPATNPASVEAKESVTPAMKPMLGRDALTQETNEQLAASRPGNPSFQPAEMHHMHQGASGHTEGMQHEHSTAPQKDAGDEKPATAKSDYTCPMHPQIHQDKPGKCPMCGMALIRKQEGPQ